MAKALHSLMRKAALAALLLLGLAAPSMAATLYISEYANIGSIGSNTTPWPPGPVLASQTVGLSGASAASSAFNSQTKAVLLTCDEGCSISFGTNGASPTATTGTTLLQQGQPYVFVTSGGQMVAAIANAAGNTATGGGTLPAGAATSANQTNGAQKTQIVDGSGNVVATTSNALNAQLYSAGVAVTYLPPGQATMATSTPVAIASDQSAVPTTGNVSALAAAGLVPVANTAVGSSVVLKNSAGNLSGFEVAATSALGLVEVFNAASAPADGAVTPVKCYNVPTTSTLAVSYNPPLQLSAGGVVVFSSSTTCFTKTTGVNTAFISGDMK